MRNIKEGYKVWVEEKDAGLGIGYEYFVCFDMGKENDK